MRHQAGLYATIGLSTAYSWTSFSRTNTSVQHSPQQWWTNWSVLLRDWPEAKNNHFNPRAQNLSCDSAWSMITRHCTLHCVVAQRPHAFGQQSESATQSPMSQADSLILRYSSRRRLLLDHCVWAWETESELADPIELSPT